MPRCSSLREAVVSNLGFYTRCPHVDDAGLLMGCSAPQGQKSVSRMDALLISAAVIDGEGSGGS
jgi:hypothetical protein